MRQAGAPMQQCMGGRCCACVCIASCEHCAAAGMGLSTVLPLVGTNPAPSPLLVTITSLGRPDHALPFLAVYH